MPNLVHGHLRFTEEDYIYTDFYETVKLDIQSEEFKAMNDLKIEKTELKTALVAFAQLAYANGYTIHDLMK